MPEQDEQDLESGLWADEIDGLEAFFGGVALSEPIRFSPAETITNPRLFIEGHIETARHNNGKPSFLPYLERLRMLKALVEERIQPVPQKQGTDQ